MSRTHPDELKKRPLLGGWIITARSPSSKSDWIVWPDGQLEQVTWGGNPSEHHHGEGDRASHTKIFIRSSPEHTEIVKMMDELAAIRQEMVNTAQENAAGELKRLETEAQRQLFGEDAVIEAPDKRPSWQVPVVSNIDVGPACLHPFEKVVNFVCQLCTTDLRTPEPEPAPATEPTAEETEDELESYSERPAGPTVDEDDMGDTVAPVVTSEDSSTTNHSVTAAVADPPNTAERWACQETDPHFECCTDCAHHNQSPQAMRGHRLSKDHIAAADAA